MKTGWFRKRGKPGSGKKAGGCVDHPEAGLSLLEVTLVLVITGILYGGLVKGYQLMGVARMQAVASMVETCRHGTHVFLEQYGALPGDFSQPGLLGKGLQPGKGNGMVDGDGTDPESEAFHFWAHLNAAGLGPGSGASPPESSLGGVLTVQHNAQGYPGLWLLLGEKGRGALLTPAQARVIARKTGGGDHPAEGSVRVVRGEGASGPCIREGRYDEEDTSPSCIVFFRIF